MKLSEYGSRLYRWLPLLLALILPPWIVLGGWLQARADIGIVGAIWGGLLLALIGHWGARLLARQSLALHRRGLPWQGDQADELHDDSTTNHRRDAAHRPAPRARLDEAAAGRIGAALGLLNGAFSGYLLATALYDAGLLG